MRVPRVGALNEVQRDVVVGEANRTSFFFATFYFRKRVNLEASKCSSRPSVRPSRSVSREFLMRAEKRGWNIIYFSKELWEKKLSVLLFCKENRSPQSRILSTWCVQVVRYPNFFFSGMEADRNVKVVGGDVAVL